MHEAYRTCGVGAEIGMRVMEEAFDYLDAPIKRLTGPDVPIPCSGPLEEMFAPSSADIVSAVKELLL